MMRLLYSMMKKKFTQSQDGNKLLQLSSISAAMLLFSAPAYSDDKVVIEGGPAEIQVSDRDGSPEPVDPANNKLKTPVPVVPAAPDAAVIQPVPNSDVQVLVPMKSTDTEGRVITEVKPVPTVPPTPTRISASQSKRIAEIKRELEIAESATAARAIFEANDLFTKKSAVIEDSAKPTLKMLAEFMELTPKDKATVSYKYVATEESEIEVRTRALALVNYLASTAGATTTEFTILDPVPVVDENPTTTPSGQFITTAKALIEITLK